MLLRRTASTPDTAKECISARRDVRRPACQLLGMLAPRMWTRRPPGRRLREVSNGRAAAPALPVNIWSRPAWRVRIVVLRRRRLIRPCLLRLTLLQQRRERPACPRRIRSTHRTIECCCMVMAALGVRGRWPGLRQCPARRDTARLAQGGDLDGHEPGGPTRHRVRDQSLPAGSTTNHCQPPIRAADHTVRAPLAVNTKTPKGSRRRLQ